jgi:hypothetical protein
MEAEKLQGQGATIPGSQTNDDPVMFFILFAAHRSVGHPRAIATRRHTTPPHTRERRWLEVAGAALCGSEKSLVLLKK